MYRPICGRYLLRLLGIALLVFALVSISPLPKTVAADKTASDAHGLVRRAVQNEVSAVQSDSEFWRYRLRKETASGTQVKEMVETKNGIVARLVAVNDRPITTEQRAQDDQRLAKLIADPEEQRKKHREQADEANRVLSLIRALPDALLYEYDGNEKVNGRNTVRLKFTPNPKFSPTTRETYVYKGTSGFLWIDAGSERIVKLDATLSNNVNIGWGGILGHINKGGHFVLEQSMPRTGKWKLSTIVLEATGKLLIFKSVSLKQRQFGSDYRPVPPTLDIAQAVELLKAK